MVNYQECMNSNFSVPDPCTSFSQPRLLNRTTSNPQWIWSINQITVSCWRAINQLQFTECLQHQFKN